jgi:isopenicillin N synthase-like dioxygenase
MSGRVPELSLRAYTDGDAAARVGFSDALMRGLQDYGFIVLKDHAVSPELLDRAYALAEQLFALDEPAKRHYAAGMRGYTPFGVEHAKDSGHPDLKEFWQIGHDASPDTPADQPFLPNLWPAEVPDFRGVFQALFAALNDTGMVLLRALAPKLGLAEHHFDPLVRYGTSLLRVLHYPPLAEDQDLACVRSAAHEDINFMTLMPAAKGAGLELLDRDGTWLPVETDPANLIVDSGDMLARMTNGVIPATTHRVINPTGVNVSRYSMPFFMHPTLATSLKVLPSCMGQGARFPPISAGEYLQERLRQIGLSD